MAWLQFPFSSKNLAGRSDFGLYRAYMKSSAPSGLGLPEGSLDFSSASGKKNVQTAVMRTGGKEGL
jgi:hypothetical protein